MNDLANEVAYDKAFSFVRSLVGSYVLQPDDLVIDLVRMNREQITVLKAVMTPAQLDYGKIIGKQGRNLKALEIILRRFGKVLMTPVEPIVKQRSAFQSANPPHSPDRIKEDWTIEDIKPIIVKVLIECEMEQLSVRIKKDPANHRRSFFAIVGYYQWDDYKVLEAISLKRGKVGVPLAAWVMQDAEDPANRFHDEIDWSKEYPKRIRAAEKIIENIAEDVTFGLSFMTLLAAIAKVQGHELIFDISLMESK